MYAVDPQPSRSDVEGHAPGEKKSIRRTGARQFLHPVECCARSRGCLRWRGEVGAEERIRQLVGDGAEGGDRLLGGRLPRHPLGGARLRGGGHTRQGASRPAAPHLSLSPW
jgi:hypothetical protein